MANQEAWSEGWDAGERAKKQKKKGASKEAQQTGAGASGGKNPWSILSYIPKLHKGGKVRKSGAYNLHKGEIVLTKSQAKMCSGKPTKKKGARKRIATKA